MGKIPTEVDPAAGPGCRIGARPPRTRAWRGGEVVAEGFPVADLSDWLEHEDAMVWLDLCSPEKADLHVIADEFGLDPLAVEDAAGRHERAKLDRYPGYLFVNVYVTELDEEGVRSHEVSAFVTERALVTVRQDTGFDVDELIGRWDDAGLTRYGAAALLYGLLDMVGDVHLATLERLDEEAADLEEVIFDSDVPVRQVQHRSFLLRKRLVQTRRAVLPLREILDGLLRREAQRVPREMAGYFRDVYDHAVHAADWTDNLRETVGNLLDARISIQSNRLNEVMKKVTSWAAIIAIPTAVTGFYGQNVPYPGSGQHWGFVTSTIIIVVCSLSLYAVFKVKDWL